MTMMTDAQRRFLDLHKHHFVASWRAVLGGGMVRATTDKGRTATLSVREIAELIAKGLMATTYGDALVLTEAGKAM